MRFASLLCFFMTGLLFDAGITGLAMAADKADYRVGDRLPRSDTSISTQPTYKETNWEALVPENWNPARAFEGLNLGMLSDADPRAMKALEKLRETWNNAPVVASLNGARIRIPGFIVPLENSRGQITEFLLVPYFGACIHTPPPPSNQIIHVLHMK
ncbi:MAG: DUF3299 domain-containing protein, partial [Betaproteobacteria bacterium]|nr:DUF3299 domain-containing protein [Betaproteobacteria bacterium]